MMLSRLAREFAAEISSHDWSDAPYRLDRAGHQRQWDSRATDDQLTPDETENVLINVMWVTAQVLRNLDPNLDVHEFAEACGVPRSRRLNSNGKPSGVITHGLRWNDEQPGRSHPHWEPALQYGGPGGLGHAELLRRGLELAAVGDGGDQAHVGELQRDHGTCRFWYAARR